MAVTRDSFSTRPLRKNQYYYTHTRIHPEPSVVFLSRFKGEREHQAQSPGRDQILPQRQHDAVLLLAVAPTHEVIQIPSRSQTTILYSCVCVSFVFLLSLGEREHQAQSPGRDQILPQCQRCPAREHQTAAVGKSEIRCGSCRGKGTLCSRSGGGADLLLFIYTYTYMCVCVCVYVYIAIRRGSSQRHGTVCTRGRGGTDLDPFIYIYVYIYIYVNVYVYIYIYICIYIYLNIYAEKARYAAELVEARGRFALAVEEVTI